MENADLFKQNKNRSWITSYMVCLPKVECWQKCDPDVSDKASTQLNYHGYFSPRVAAESSNNSEKGFICEIPYLL